MSKPKAPRTVEQATELLATHSEIEGQLARIQARRNASLARINAAADTLATNLVQRLEELRLQLRPWWAANGAELLPKGRKTMVLGGCTIGSRIARAKLAHAHADDKKAAAALQGTRLAKATLKISYSIDRPATLKLLQAGGKRAATLLELGFSIDEAADQFIVERAEQGSTVGS